MNEMHGQFAWSESGLKLLSNIKKEINQSGGRIALMNEIMNENRDLFVHKDWVYLNNAIAKHSYIKNKRKLEPKSDKRWTTEDVDYVLEKFGIIKTRLLAKTLNRSVYAVQNCFRMKATPEQKLNIKLYGRYKDRVKNFNK